ncbi:MAG: hypothetical protein GC168_16450 [Candidatus Hydrogenedens sp.]|nr:hypothetical protein [Candidatus Hydrogenedens sp.]
MSASRISVSLNGPWRWTGGGTAAEAAEHALYATGVALVPGAAPKVLPEPAWAIKSFSIDSIPDGCTAELRFESPSAQGEVWVNGKRAASLDAPSVPQAIVVTPLIQSGENTVAVRAAAPGGWMGSVELLLLPRLAIESLLWETDFRRGQVRVRIDCGDTGKLHLQVEDTPALIEAAPGDEAYTLDLPQPGAWSPASPKCYTLHADLIQEDGAVDRVSATFGFSEFTVKEQRFHHNLKPLFLAGAHYYAPDGADAAQVQADLEAARASGFDAVRLARPDRRVLEAADRCGMLVWCDWPAGADTAAARAIAEYYGGHPSLVAWVACNVETKDAIRAADGKRVVFVFNPALGQGGAFYRPSRDEGEPMRALTVQEPAPVDGRAEAYLRRLGSNTALGLVERVTAAALTGVEEGADAELFDAMRRERGLEIAFPANSDWANATRVQQCETARFQLDALRSNPKIAGYFYDAWRASPLPAGKAGADASSCETPLPKVLGALQRPMRPVIAMNPPNLRVREEAHVSLTLLNEERLEGRADLSLQIVGPTNQVLWKKRRGVKLPKHGRELWSGQVAASGSTGKHKFVVRVLRNEQPIAESVLEFQVLPEAASSGTSIHLLDPHDEYAKDCRPWAKLDNLLSPVHVVPPLANTILAYPDNELAQVMAQVHGGAVALVFDPPADWNDWAARIEGMPKIDRVEFAQADVAAASYVKLHPVFEHLPLRCLIRQAYRAIAPRFGFAGESEEEICGAVLAGPEGLGSLRHVVVRRFGSGSVAFVSLRVMEALANDVIAQQVFVNMIAHFARRSVPARQPLALNQQVVEWHRKERAKQVWRWLVIGEFPGEGGHDAEYPPERELDVLTTYPAAYRMARWQRWYTLERDEYELKFGEALASPWHTEVCQTASTAYAYTEFNAQRRGAMRFDLDFPGQLKAWLNGRLIFDSKEGTGPDSVTHPVKHGRNTLLVKSTVVDTPWNVLVRLKSAESLPIQVNPWK